MEKDKIIQKKYFGAKFTELYKDWKENNPGSTQTTFAKLFNPEITRQTITAWKSGTIPSDYNLKQICTVFKVPRSDFIPQSNAELYTYSTERQNAIASDILLPFCETIGLKPVFIKLIKQLLESKYDELFPIWSPLQKASFFDNEYIRKGSSALAPAEKMTDNEYLQVEVIENGETKTITLSLPDLLFLKDLQERVYDTIVFEFDRRSRSLIKEVEEINKAAADPVLIKSDGGITSRNLDLFEFDDYSRRVRNIIERR